MQVIEHEADVAVDVPIQCGGVDGLPPARDAGRGAKLIVEVDRAHASGDLPCRPVQRERMRRFDTAIGSRRRIIGVSLSGQHEVGLRVAALEFQAWCTEVSVSPRLASSVSGSQHTSDSAIRSS
jgi:hypothetical protein